MKNQGYITLISTIIISLMLLFAVTSLGERSILGRFMLLDIEKKLDSDKLAAACVQVAVISIANQPAYTVTTPVSVLVEGGRECEIYSVTPNFLPNPTESTIFTTASVDEAITNLEVTYNISAEEITLWQELSNLP